MKGHCAGIASARMQDTHSDFNWDWKMQNYTMELFDDLEGLLNSETITGNSVLQILKQHASTVSVFDMMRFTSHVMEENRYVQESYREDSQKSYIEPFLMRVRDISNDNNDYEKIIDRKELRNALESLKANYSTETSKNKTPLIFYLGSLYATFILEESIHPVGTPFPGSLKVEEKQGKFYCPVRDANIDTPNAVCNICLAEQLDF